nr:hypothetical protein [uncultured Mucilaginibacter sp.]
MSLPQLLGSLYIQNSLYIKTVLNGRVQAFNRDIPTPGEDKKTVATYRPTINEQVEGFFVHVEKRDLGQHLSFHNKDFDSAYEYINFNEQRIIKVEKSLYS